MSEIEVRMALVGPTGKSLKFLNNKNNLANMYLHKRLQAFEREKSYNMAQLDHSKIDAMEFMRHIRKREPESQQAKKLLDRSELTPTPEPLEDRRTAQRKARRKRKVRLAQTAPANMQQTKQEKSMKEVVRDALASGGEQDTVSLDTDRKKSVYLQIGGVGKETKSHVQFDDSDEEEKKRKELPKPSPRTMLDVMIGLNAFSHVPPPRCATRSPEILREEHRPSLGRRSSITSQYDSTENIAEKFIQQWRSRIASRKQSIYDKLAVESPKPEVLHPKESFALSAVPELELSSASLLRRKSKWSTRTSMKPAQLPVISQNDDQERRELFQAWVKERKDEIKTPERADSVILDPAQRTEDRRKSFACWLKKRDPMRTFYDDDDEEEEDDLKYSDPYEIDDGPHDVGDMMKTILNIKQRFRDPIDFRLKKFYKELDKIKERDARSQRPLSEKERKRKWKIVMKGLDAALAESSDEEDNYMSTV